MGVDSTFTSDRSNRNVRLKANGERRKRRLRGDMSGVTVLTTVTCVMTPFSFGMSIEPLGVRMKLTAPTEI